MFDIFLIINVVLNVLSSNFHNGIASNTNIVNKELFISELEYCRYRDQTYPKAFFKEVTGYFCYSYGSEARFKTAPYTKYNMPVKYTDNVTYIIPVSLYNKTQTFFYNYENNVSRKLISGSFATETYFQRWLECAKNADECCQKQMTNQNIRSDGDFCPAVWDAWDCFPVTNPGAVVERICPNYVYINDPPCRQNSEKTCFENATWNDQTNYETCQYVANIRNRHKFHVYTLYTSIAICLPAIIIFFYYPALRITRVILHRNLLIAIIIKNILVILSKELITINAMDVGTRSVLAENGVSCRVLAFFERAAINAVYACMLVDGYYLHKIIVAVFRRDPSIYLLYGIVAFFSLIPISVWAGFKATQANVYCWVVDDSWRQWIIDGSRYLMLGVNVILLLDIIRVLIWKLKRNHGAVEHTKATLRATFILLPLFGIQFIMMSQRPVNAPCLWDDTFYFISYAIDSLQGILVSLLYCYFNKEVQTQLKKTYQKIRIEFDYKFGTNNRRTTENLRRTTAATYVPETSRNEPKIRSPPGQNQIAEGQKELNIQEWLNNNEKHEKKIAFVENVTNC